ncbi:MAG TPA: Gfo/Idh/MocA family oxidoreductase, partial [Acidimicrobiia bacterium]|nr:Gfo/Idh/MocA family oxidoreductase [Acidimicrobiia bacterium]
MVTHVRVRRRVMRVGIIGTGFGRRVVAPVFAATEDCSVIDVVSPRDAEAVETLVNRNDVDLVSVHSPPYLHAPHVRSAISAGKAVLCDKPFALGAAQAEEMEAAAQLASIPAFVNFEFRFAPARRELRDLVRRGDLGRIHHVVWTHHSSGSRVPLRPYGWLFDRELGGGWIGAWGSHAVDSLRWIFGEITEARGRPRIDIRERVDANGAPHACTAEDGVAAWLVAGDGVSISLDSTFAAAAT